MLARYRPDLVKKIDNCGHEIAMHGDKHVAMQQITRKQATADLTEAHSLITDITGKPIHGYRAPCFSIDHENLYILECLAELGLQYDSSIFPVKLPRYGIDDFDPRNRLYQLPNGLDIVELPLTVWPLLGRRVPVAGGGYIRLMPSILVKKVFRDLLKNDISPMIYMHPYEFDSDRLNSAANFPPDTSFSRWQVAKSNFKWNVFRKSIYGKIDFLLRNYEFVTCKEKADDVRSNSRCKTVLERA